MLKNKVYNEKVATKYIVLFLIMSFFCGVFIYVMWNITLAEQDTMIVLEMNARVNISNPTRIERVKEWKTKLLRLDRKEIKGVYLTAYSAGNINKMTEIVDLINKTELNAVVIDIKDYSGHILYDSNVPLVNELEMEDYRMNRLAELIDALHKYDIYVIARQTVFQDPLLAQKKPEWALKNTSGGMWRDHKGLSWVDPSRQEIWDYNVAIAKEASDLGFDEVNFDYVRFPSDGNMSVLVYNNGDKKKYTVMGEFFSYLNKQLSNTPVNISLDMFGFVMEKNGEDDMSIGQRLTDALGVVDAIDPMMYPSHYPSGHLGLMNPADFPGLVIENGMKKGAGRFEGTNTSLRPWIQAFNLGAVYDAGKIREQIDMVEKYSPSGWLLWNASNRYSTAGLRLVETSGNLMTSFRELLSK